MYYLPYRPLEKTVIASYRQWMKTWDQFSNGHHSNAWNIKLGWKTIILHCCLHTAYPPFDSSYFSQSASSSVTLFCVFLFFPLNFCLIPCSLICRGEGKLHLLEPRDMYDFSCLVLLKCKSRILNASYLFIKLYPSPSSEPFFMTASCSSKLVHLQFCNDLYSWAQQKTKRASYPQQ